MMDELMGAYGGRLVIAILGVGIGFLCLVGVLWILRGRRGPSPFIRGGRNRQPRLQVLDAAAVDARRRLVLVRRDDIEHLIMIGGPTDIVIESGISMAAGMAQEPAIDAPPKARTPREPVVGASVVPPPAEPRREPPKPQPAPIATQAVVPPRKPPPPMPVAPAAMQTPVQAPAPFLPAIGPAAPIIPTAEPVPAVVSTHQPPVAPMNFNEAPVLSEAADILDAARGRVFQGPTEPVRPSAIDRPVDPVNTEPAPPKPLGSEFERILEEEMAANLATREPATPAVGNANPEKSKVTGATPEPSLQDEMARIFGEMSVTRDK